MHMLVALLKEILHVSQPDMLDAHKTEDLSQYERYSGDPKDILTLHAKTEINIIMLLINA